MGRFGLLPSAVDNTLYDAFGERQVSTIYNAMNQYAVVMEVAPRYWQSPETLKDIWVSTAGGTPSGTETTDAVVGTFVASYIIGAINAGIVSAGINAFYTQLAFGLVIVISVVLQTLIERRIRRQSLTGR